MIRCKETNCFFLFSVGETFHYMLQKKSSMTEFCLWVNRLVDTYVKGEADRLGLITASNRFILVWTTFGNKIFKMIKQVRMNNATSKTMMKIIAPFVSISKKFKNIYYGILIRKMKRNWTEDT